MAKSYRVISIKLNRLVKRQCPRSVTNQQSVFKRCHSGKDFSEILPTRWRQKSTGIDMEENYVTVTLRVMKISKLHFRSL